MILGPPLLYILWAGDVARDVAQRLASGFDQEQKAASSGSACSVEPLSALRKLVSSTGSEKIWVVVVVQTVEQGAIAEDGASALRFLQRRDHANNFLKGRVNFAVMVNVTEAIVEEHPPSSFSFYDGLLLFFLESNQTPC